MSNNHKLTFIVELIVVIFITDLIFYLGGNYTENFLFIDSDYLRNIYLPFTFFEIIFSTFILFINAIVVYQFFLNDPMSFFSQGIVIHYYVVLILVVNLLSILGVFNIIRKQFGVRLVEEDSSNLCNKLLRDNIKWTMLYFSPIVSLGYICNKSNPFYNKETDKTTWDRICKTKVVDVTIKKTSKEISCKQNFNRSMIDATVLEFISIIIFVYIIKMYFNISFITCYSLWINILINYILYAFIGILLTIPMSLSRYTNLIYYGFRQKITTLQGEKPKSIELIVRSVIKWTMLIYYPLIWLVGKIIGRNLFIDKETGLTYWDKKSNTRVVEIEE